MKKLISFLMMAVLAVSAMAQSETTRTIHGAVIDKNGNPLPGASVFAEGGAETTITESDGTFSLEVPKWLKKASASYAGYRKKTMKTDFNDEMIFTLKSKKDGAYFLNVVGGPVIGYPNGEVSGYAGLKGGYLGNWGWYAEVGWDFLAGQPQAIIGAVKKLKGPNYCYLGLGYGSCGYWGDGGMAIDFGYQAQIGSHFDLSVGLTCTTCFEDEGVIVPKISFGYAF